MPKWDILGTFYHQEHFIINFSVIISTTLTHLQIWESLARGLCCSLSELLFCLVCLSSCRSVTQVSVSQTDHQGEKHMSISVFLALLVFLHIPSLSSFFRLWKLNFDMTEEHLYVLFLLLLFSLNYIKNIIFNLKWETNIKRE